MHFKTKNNHFGYPMLISYFGKLPVFVSRCTSSLRFFVLCKLARRMFTCSKSSQPHAQPKFSSAQQLEASLKTCCAHVKAAISSLALDADMSLEQQRLFTNVVGLLASMSAHAEFAKTAGVQIQACELCKCLVTSIKSGGKSLDDHMGEMLADVLLAQLHQPQPKFLAPPDLLCLFGELCLTSAKTRACAIQGSATHQIAALISQGGCAADTEKQAYIALCKLLVQVEHAVFESCFVDLLVHKTIEAPHDGQCTAWTLTALCTMQEKNERALEYIWTRSAVSRAIFNVLSSHPSGSGCPENMSKIARLLRIPARRPKLRMLLARSGVWEVLLAMVSCPASTT